ncbi:leucine-rich repeat protein, partial [bacterium 210820-DFI.6.37]|nr:leucine-rich repeat protein [bacterium 210820-DFI.6.37]
LSSITIPEGVTIICDDAFEGCSSLSSITIPEGVTRIGVDAFYGCSSLSSIKILNPNCKIITSIPSFTVIYGYANSTAQAYAERYNRTFVVLGTEEGDTDKNDPTGSDNDGSNLTPPQKLAQTIAAKSYTKTYGSKPFSLGARTNGNGKLTYKSSNAKVATVSSAGKVTLKGTGKATITITAAATDTYKAATKKVTITVKPKKVTGLKVKAAKKKMTISWKKDTKATGYQLTYALNSKFTKSKKSVTISKNKTTKKTISKLKSGKTYYAKVRAYKTVGKTRLYGAYSSVKKIRVK